MPTIKWFKDNKEITKSSKVRTSFVPETGVATLEVLKVTPDEEPVFRIEAVNKFGKAECRANLVPLPLVSATQPTVMQAPKITKPVNAVVGKADEDIVLEVEFVGSPTPKVEWFRNNKTIKPTKEYEIKTDDQKTTLVIRKTAKHKSGKYEVKVTNPKGEAKSSGSVVIEEKETEGVPPKFIKPVESQVVSMGEVAILEATVEAVPFASFQWYYQAMPITHSKEFKIVTSENRSVLLINEVTPDLIGTFTCRAENSIGSVTSTAELSVIEDVELEETKELEYPRFVKQPSPTRVMDGQKVTFECVVVGKPTPRVQWFHNDVPIEDAKDVIISQDSEGVCTLTITEAFPENSGEYVCYAKNPVGEAVCRSTLIVEGTYILSLLSLNSCNNLFVAYEYVPDSEIGIMTGQSGSEEDLLDKVCNCSFIIKFSNLIKTRFRL